MQKLYEHAEFYEPEAARKFIEAALWPNGPVCPHCNSSKHYVTKREGIYRCAQEGCRKDYTVREKTIMHRSHTPLHIWLRALELVESGEVKNAHALKRELRTTYRTACYLWDKIGLVLAVADGEGRPPVEMLRAPKSLMTT